MIKMQMCYFLVTCCSQLFPYDVNAVKSFKGANLQKLLLQLVGVWTSEQKWLDSIDRKRRGWQAVRLEVGGVHGQDCTTWIRHCSTCLLISSSLPANGALHSGHTCPPSSGFLLFIFPIRAGNGTGSQKKKTERHFVNVHLSYKPLKFLRMFLWTKTSFPLQRLSHVQHIHLSSWRAQKHMREGWAGSTWTFLKCLQK